MMAKILHDCSHTFSEIKEFPESCPRLNDKDFSVSRGMNDNEFSVNEFSGHIIG